jgi:hypothetical protein
VFLNTSDTKELLAGLDKLITRNELRLRELGKELEKLDQMEQAEVEKVREGKVSGRTKNNALRSIKRMRRQLDNLEERMDIYDRNINLHLNLIGRIQQVEAMSLAGVDEAQIDDIILDFETHFEQYTETVAAGEAATAARETLKSASDNELAELESEIRGEAEPQPRRAGEKELRDLEKEILADKPRAKKKRKAEADGEA